MRSRSLASMRCAWKPNVKACLPVVQLQVVLERVVVEVLGERRASVPRHCVGAFGPANAISGNDESASPAGNPRSPALIGYRPSIVALKIGTDSRENPSARPDSPTATRARTCASSARSSESPRPAASRCTAAAAPSAHSCRRGTASTDAACRARRAPTPAARDDSFRSTLRGDVVVVEADRQRCRRGSCSAGPPLVGIGQKRLKVLRDRRDAILAE